MNDAGASRATLALASATGSVGLGTTGAKDWRNELVGDELRFVEDGTRDSMEQLGYTT